MDINPVQEQLKRNTAVFESLFKTFTNENEWLWKAGLEKWCALEILCHLYDEEREDFRARIDHIFKQPEVLDMPSISPVSWVTERYYLEKPYFETLSLFLKERTNSIQYLTGAHDQNWKRSFEHKFLGEVTPVFYLKNWVAHDYLHIRQLVKLKYDMLDASPPFLSLEYAGLW